MLTVVAWKWRRAPGFPTEFKSAHVNALLEGLRRHCSLEHELVCVTDDPAGIDPDVRIVPIWRDLENLPNPSGPKAPSCYRRLRLFAPNAAEIFGGERLLSIDLDVQILADPAPLWSRPEDFVIWGDTQKSTPYNGSMVLLTAGARPRVWTDFDPATSPAKGQALGYRGSDQAWISACLGPNETKWTKRDGVVSFRNDVGFHSSPSTRARLVFFHGQHKPWSPECQRLGWVRRSYWGKFAA